MIGRALADDGLTERAVSGCAQPPSERALKTADNLDEEDRQAILRAHEDDELPAGWFHNG